MIMIIIIITINPSNHLDQRHITSVFDNWENKNDVGDYRSQPIYKYPSVYPRGSSKSHHEASTSTLNNASFWKQKQTLMIRAGVTFRVFKQSFEDQRVLV